MLFKLQVSVCTKLHPNNLVYFFVGIKLYGLLQNSDKIFVIEIWLQNVFVIKLRYK